MNEQQIQAICAYLNRPEDEADMRYAGVTPENLRAALASVDQEVEPPRPRGFFPTSTIKRAVRHLQYAGYDHQDQGGDNWKAQRYALFPFVDPNECLTDNERYEIAGALVDAVGKWS